jgi:hypothetical protein
MHSVHHPLVGHRAYPLIVFLIGALCMTVAGYLLIDGLSHFSGDDSTRRVLITVGVLFQVTESLCFIIAATPSAAHSALWRVGFFCFGTLIFIFSIAVMTLAQKTALQSGEFQAAAIDEKREHLRAQIASLDQVIDSYRHNAERQSNSVYKDSRELGQDSINRAAELEQKKLGLSDELFSLNQTRRETSGDFFSQLENVTGLPAKQTEFYFLVVRSLLIELSGILLLAYGARLGAGRIISPIVPPVSAPPDPDRDSLGRAEWTSETGQAGGAGQPPAIAAPPGAADPPRPGRIGADGADRPPEPPAETPKPTAHAAGRPPGAPPAHVETAAPAGADAPTKPVDSPPLPEGNVIPFTEGHSYSSYIQRMKLAQQRSAVPREIDRLSQKVLALHRQGEIDSFGRDAIIKALRKHHKINIGSRKAEQVKEHIESVLGLPGDGQSV